MFPTKRSLMTVAFVLLATGSGNAAPTWLPSPFRDVNGTGSDTGNNPQVAAITTWDPDGVGPQSPSLVVGGRLGSIEGVPVSGVAARDAATGQWQRLGPLISPNSFSNVGVLTVYNGDLIAAGRMNGGPWCVARWNGTSWIILGGYFDSDVYALAVYNGDLIAAGYFTNGGLNHIGRWNGSSWVPLGSGTDRVIRALTVFNGELIAGGTVGQASGQDPMVARWDGASWQPMNAGVFEVRAFLNDGGQLFAGGTFTPPGSQPVRGVAIWDGASWSLLGGAMNGEVYSVARYDGYIYAGGIFSLAGGQQALCIARWSGSSWQPLGAGIAAAPQGVGLSTGVLALGVYAAELIVGGDFTSAGLLEASDIARWNGTTWYNFGGSVTRVIAFTPFGSRMIAGGVFSQSTPGYDAAHIVSWDGVAMTSLGSGMDSPVFALKSFKYPGALGPYELIAGGSFSFAGGVSAHFIARWTEDPVGGTPPAWSAMGAGFSNAVYAIERFNNQTYAGGAFNQGSGLGRIARWNETTDVWEALGTGMNGPVYALKDYGGYLYAGGSFTTAGGVATGGLARWNGSSWSQVGGNFLGTVYALEVHNGNLVMAGLYPGINASPNIAQYNGTSYSTLGTGGTNAPVKSLRSSDGLLYMGGEFTSAGGVPANHLAVWNGAAWSEVQGGADNFVLALGSYNGEVQAGGEFVHAGGTLTSHGWARYSPTGVPWIAKNPSAQTRTTGQDASFIAEPATDYSGVSYRWYRNGTPLYDNGSLEATLASTISGATTRYLGIHNVSTADVGYYQLVATNASGSDTSTLARLTVDGIADVPDAEPRAASVFRAIGPNPTTGLAHLDFTLTRESRVRVHVRDVAGRRVRTLDVGKLSPGNHRAPWDGRGNDGTLARIGLYFVELEVDGRALGMRRLTVLR